MRKLTLSLLASVLVFLPACTPAGPRPIATVNGIEISREEFRRELDYELASFGVTATELSDDELELIEDAVLERLINNALLLEAAAALGITRETVDLEATMAAIISNYDDVAEFEEELGESGFTLEEFRGLIADALIIEDLFEVELQLSTLAVSAEEVDALVSEYLTSLGDDAQDLDPDAVRLHISYALKEELAYELKLAFIQELWEQSVIQYFEH